MDLDAALRDAAQKQKRAEAAGMTRQEMWDALEGGLIIDCEHSGSDLFAWVSPEHRARAITARLKWDIAQAFAANEGE